MKKYFFKKTNIQHKRGFTIMETLVAILILLAVITGPLAFIQSGLRASFVARDQIVAFYLAQDAMEAIKNILDNTYFTATLSLGSPIDWLSGLGVCTPENTGETKICKIDTSNPTNFIIESCDGNCLLYKKTDTRQFVISPNDNEITRYTRDIYITEVEDNKELQVIIHVQWDSNFFGTKEIIVQENLFNKIPQ